MPFKYLIICFLLSNSGIHLSGQDEYTEEEYYDSGTYVGIKGGFGLGSQIWQNQLTNEVILVPSFDVFSETFDAYSFSSLYAQLGYHQRGSGLGIGTQVFASYRFHNMALELGGKRIFHEINNRNIYWLIGVRGEYTLGTNINSQRTSLNFNALDQRFVNKINYGMSVGIGIQQELEHQQVVFIDLVFNPDFSNQYDQPLILGPFQNPFNTAQSIFIDPQAVRNYTLELKIGYKWLR